MTENDSNMFHLQLNNSDVLSHSLACAEIVVYSMKKRAGLEWIRQFQYAAAMCATPQLLLKLEHDYIHLDPSGCLKSAMYGLNKELENGGDAGISYVDCFKLLLDRGTTVKMMGEMIEVYPLAVAWAIQACRRRRSSSVTSNVMNLKDGHLLSIPTRILDSSHANLVHLNFSNNAIEEVPLQLFDLPMAKLINLSHNKIKKLPPPEKWNCSRLASLNISYNLLTGCTENQSWFGNLIANKVKPVVGRVMNKLGHVRGSSIFRSTEHRASADCRLDKLQALASVNISNNKLEAVPVWITLLPDLKSVKFAGNACLNYLPPQLLQYSKNLISIDVEGLNLICPPMAEVRRGSSHIRCYLFSQLRNAVNYWHMRLMLVGRCAAGKTTLVARLKGRSLPKNLSTVGLDLSVFSYKPTHFNFSPQVTFHTLDFAGQEDYYATHQCFFTKVAVYLALFDLRKGKEGLKELQPWLLSIHACVPGAVVIIVGTHLDIVTKLGYDCKDMRTEVETQFLFGQTKATAASHGLPHVIDFLCVSSVTGFGVPQLKKRLYEASFCVDHPDCKDRQFFGVRVPACHLFIQECLENKAMELLKSKQAPVLTKEEFVSLVIDHPKNDIQDALEVEQASRFLHELGAMLHYENASGELQNLYFIDLQFLSTAMACIVTSSERSLVKNGILHFATLPLLFKGGEVPPELYRQFMQLLQHFEVAIPLDKEQQTFLIPAMLHKSKPSYCIPKYLEEMVAVGRRYSMKYVPVGFWSRLISRITVFAHAVGCTLLQAPETIQKNEGGNLSLESQVSGRQCWSCWQRGMIIVKEDGSFLVLEDAKGHQGVDVIVGGNNVECSKLLSTSGHHIDTLLGEFYPGLCCRSSSTVEKLAFCPNCLQQSWPLIDETDSSLLYNVTDFLENHVTLCCHRCESSLSLREVAPDILLLDLPNHLHLQSDKLVLQETDENCIGEGGYGKVQQSHNHRYNFMYIAVTIRFTVLSTMATTLH